MRQHAAGEEPALPAGGSPGKVLIAWRLFVAQFTLSKVERAPQSDILGQLPYL